ncbi:TMEM175 family protein [Paraburkholderia hayleyella]|uniref:TMEM175 family protein n=1 Tax=Paraburkholderia hayleyella TaxID=2152889 RepID=UPI0012920C39|nr:TMEM175 family protein [Paraburkholderia hayleyella]
MGKGRIEAFSDGVIAIIITIMVLELRVPEGASLAALRPLLPVFCAYVLSFIYVGIYWSNHHPMFHAVQKVNGAILWANLHLLFWLSLLPAVTHWIGESPLSAWPGAMYGMVLFMAAIAYFILTHVLMRHHGADSTLARAMGRDVKGKMSVGLYLAGVALAFVAPWVSALLYTLTAAMWLIPDRRIERVLSAES